MQKGITRIGFPDLPKAAVGYLLRDTGIWIWIGLAFALGGYLTWVGFEQG